MTLVVLRDPLALRLRTQPLQPDRLWARLGEEMDDAEALAALADGRRGLISSRAVMLGDTQVQSIHAAVALLDRVMRQPAVRYSLLALIDRPDLLGRGPCAGVLAFDFHLTAAGPRLIEINTNPGGLLLNAALTRAAGGGAEVTVDALSFAGDGGNVAIVDDAPRGQFLWPEFLLYRRLFQQAGRGAAIVQGADLRWDAHGLTDADGQGPFDAVYNRLTDFQLTRLEHAALVQAWRLGAVAVTPDPAAHTLLSDKRLLALLSSSAALAAHGVASADAAATAALVPPTILLCAETRESLWEGRRRLFFKPATGFGGKAAYRGDKISRSTWDNLADRSYVAQELVPPPRADIDPDTSFKVDIRAYARDGRVALLAARLYDGQTTNFRTPGGGFAPVLVG
ncbi:MAG: hypothetical protein ACM31D_04000 [Bacteroidota bacterium]